MAAPEIDSDVKLLWRLLIFQSARLPCKQAMYWSPGRQFIRPTKLAPVPFTLTRPASGFAPSRGRPLKLYSTVSAGRCDREDRPGVFGAFLDGRAVKRAVYVEEARRRVPAVVRAKTVEYRLGAGERDRVNRSLAVVAPLPVVL